MIEILYKSCDGVRLRRKFKTLKGAQRFAQLYVGPHPEIGTRYAVSPEGIGIVYVAGATLDEIFPETTDVKQHDSDDRSEPHACL